MPSNDPLERLATRDKEILAAFVEEFHKPEDVKEFIEETRQRAKDYDRLIWLFKGVRVVATWVAVVATGWAVFRGWLPGGQK